MGALTESGKATADVFCLNRSIPRPLSSNWDYNFDFPPTKKARLNSMPPALGSHISYHTSEISISKIQRYPVPLPLQRPVHAPQRHSKFSRSVILDCKSLSPVREKEDRIETMGNLFTKLREAKLNGFMTVNWFGEGENVMDVDQESPKNESIKGLSRDAYKRLVEGQDGYSVVFNRSCEVGQSSEVTDVHLQASSLEVSGLRLPNSAKGVTEQLLDDPSSEPSSKGTIKGPPVYKTLLESSRIRNSKLNDIDFEVKLFEKKLSTLKFSPKDRRGGRKEGPFSTPTNTNIRKSTIIVLDEIDFQNTTKNLIQEQLDLCTLLDCTVSLAYFEDILFTGNRKTDVIQELFVPLTDQEEDEVSQALYGFNRREVLVTHESSNIEITREVLQCLRPSAWLNDEVINLYLELLKERERSNPKKFLKCHFFNTFFYKKLISGRNGYDYNAVRRWTTQRKIGYSLMECDKIFVPIHKEVHWCLAVINMKDKSFQYLDSLGGWAWGTQVIKVLAKYLVDEAKEKSKKEINVSSWKQEVVDDLPEQENGWDCGMFMIKYADFYSRGLSLCFNQEHMPYFRNRTAKEILRLKVD